MIPFSQDQISRYTAQGAWGTATLDDIFRACTPGLEDEASAEEASGQ